MATSIVQVATHQGEPAERTAPPARTDLDGRLLDRRRRVARTRQWLLVADLAVSTVVAATLLVDDYPIGAAAAVALCLAVLASTYAADGLRAMVAVAPVLRCGVTVTAAMCVWAALTADRGSAQQALLGAAGASGALICLRGVAHVPGLSGLLGLGRRRRLVVGDQAALERTAARRAASVAAGSVVLAVTRAEGGAVDYAPRHARPGPPDSGRDQRHRTDTPHRPAGMVERIVRTALDHGAERVTVLPGESWGRQQLRELSWLLEDTGIDLVIATELDGIAPHRVGVVTQEGRLGIKVGSAVPRGAKALGKSALDRVAAAVLLVLLAPLLGAIAFAIRKDSPGPALFRQTRVRAGGSTFTMLKFRTMYVDAEAHLEQLRSKSIHGEDGPLFKMTDDPRVTRLGSLLRRTSLDELPQLVNVLRGEMSLIGPRPALPVEVELYDYVARRRLAVKPGMTGLWQVSGRSRLSWDESIGFDLEYVDNWSPAADAAIVVRTLRAVLTRDGAY